MGEVTIPKQSKDVLETAGIKTYKDDDQPALEITVHPKKKRRFMDIGVQEPKKSFFGDPYDRTWGGKTALTSPKTYSDTYRAAFNDLYEFGRSVSSFQGLSTDWELVQQEMKDKFDIEIPHFTDHIPEVDDKYDIPKWSFDGVGGTGEAPYKEKIKYLENLFYNFFF